MMLRPNEPSCCATFEAMGIHTIDCPVAEKRDTEHVCDEHCIQHAVPIIPRTEQTPTDLIHDLLALQRKSISLMLDTVDSITPHQFQLAMQLQNDFNATVIALLSQLTKRK